MESATTTISLSPTIKICNNECTKSDSDKKKSDADLENSYIENSTDSASVEIESNERSTDKQVFAFNEIPEPIQVLDDILSEFEEPDSLPPTLNHGSSFHENHSEDDGYMSLNGRRCDINSSQSAQKMSPTAINSKPEEILDVSPQKPCENFAKETTVSSDILNKDLSQNGGEPAAALIQSTLPKSRSNDTNKSNYSSLPCSALRSTALENKLRVGSCSGERNILGIDISAVHNAVLRGGVAKLPEPIVNEHPVTIYPGRSSPPGGITRNARQHIACSVQTYKDVCRKINTQNWSNKLHNFSTKSKVGGLKDDEYSNHLAISSNKISPKEFRIVKAFNTDVYEDSEDFSDDSLDGPANVSPCNMTFSAPVTPYKRNGIAWEIKFKNNRHADLRKSRTSNNVDHRCHKKNEACLKNSSSKTSNRKDNSPELIVPVQKLQIDDIFKNYNDVFKIDDAFTELDGSMLGKGTFIIRKRPRDRVQGSELYDIMSPSNIEHETSNINVAKAEQLNVELEAPRNLSRTRLSLDLDIEHSTAGLNDSIKKHTKMMSQKETTPETNHMGSPHTPLTLGHGLTSFNTSPMYATQEDACDVKPSFELLNKSSSSNSLESSKNICDSFQSMKNSNGLRSPGSNELISNCTTPHRELVPPLEEEEEQCSESQSGCAPLRQIEHNISALLRGDIAVARIGESSQSRRSLGYRPGVHKSESAKEMLLSQNAFGPLPPSPPSSSSELNDCDELPPLPPSPTGTDIDDNILDSEFISTTAEMHPSPQLPEESRSNSKLSKYLLNDLPLPPTPQEIVPPAVPPHRGAPSNHTLRSRSIDSNYTRKCPKTISHSGSTILSMGYGNSACDVAYTTRRVVGSYGLKRNLKQSPREEHRLQTSCSLPETPIFARGCDIARTPHRRQTEYAVGSGSRTAPRTGASQTPIMGSSILGISGGSTLGVGACRQRTISHALASGEMLRLSGGPARGWYPKQRSMRPASTENIDRLPPSHTSSMRVWDSAGGMAGTGQVRKPLTLPPNLTPSFLNKSPREALRRVTSLLINKKGNTKERDNKMSKENMALAVMVSNNGVGSLGKSTLPEPNSKQCHASQKSQKKKGFFKQFWKKSKHYSLDQ